MIELYKVSKVVPSGAEALTILHELDLQIPDGQFVAVVGPSGSGKSTLLGLVAGLDAPTSGRINIDGEEITRMGEDALTELMELDVPLGRPVDPEPGRIQKLTPACDALFVPNIDESLDEEHAKRQFWRAFRRLGDWYADLPPY